MYCCLWFLLKTHGKGGKVYTKSYLPMYSILLILSCSPKIYSHIVKNTFLTNVLIEIRNIFLIVSFRLCGHLGEEVHHNH